MSGQTMNHQPLVRKCVLVVVFMFGFCFALVPLYNSFCKFTGLQGKFDSGRVRVALENEIDTTRTVTVHFVSHIMSGLDWEFYPEVHKVVVHPGELRRIHYRAKNYSGTDSVSQAIPSIAPGLASLYFKKTECFCFNQQFLASGKQADMPLVFFLDRDLPADIEELTLSYTLFNAKDNKQTAPLVIT